MSTSTYEAYYNNRSRNGPKTEQLCQTLFQMEHSQLFQMEHSQLFQMEHSQLFQIVQYRKSPYIILYILKCFEFYCKMD